MSQQIQLAAQINPLVNVHGTELDGVEFSHGCWHNKGNLLRVGIFLKDYDCLIFKQAVHCLNSGIFLPNGETQQKQVYNLALVFHMAECDK